MKGVDRLIYAVVRTRRGGGGGGGVKCEGRASGVLLACGFLACRFCLLALYDTGRVGSCQGGIFVRFRRTGDSRVGGNDGRGWDTA